MYYILIMEKTCSKCGFVGDAVLFSKSNKTKDGRRGMCKKCKSESDKKWRRENKEKTSAYFKKLWRNPKRKIMNRLYVDKIRFGFNAETFILDKECDLCGINNEDHLKKYGQRLQIHHRDNQGRHNQRDGLPPNNQESNLQVLCKSCHVKVDNKLKDYTGRSEKAWRTRRKNQKKK